MGPDDIQRDVLPIPDIPPAGLTTYDAKDPDTNGSPVTTDYGARKFTGEVKWVELDVGLDDHNHMIAPEDRVSLAMGLQ